MITETINKHLDAMEGIRDEFKAELGRVVRQLDLAQLLKQPDEFLALLRAAVVQLVERRHVKQVVEENRSFFKNVQNESDKKA